MSSKQLTCWSDFRYPLSAPDHPTLPNFVEYLNSYADEFKLREHIYLSTKVVKLEKEGDLKHPHVATVRRSNAHGEELSIQIAATRVVIATGLHVTPAIPSIIGLNAPPLANPPIDWMHSSEYKSRDQLKDKRVLVLGAGETGMDVAYESVHVAKKTWLGVRTGFLSFPKVGMGVCLLIQGVEQFPHPRLYIRWRTSHRWTHH